MDHDPLLEIRDILRDRLIPGGAIVELDSNSSAGKFKVRVRAQGETAAAAGADAYREFVRLQASIEEAQAQGWRETLDSLTPVAV